MDSSWTTVPAEEFCTSVRDGTHDSPRPVENGKLLVTTRHLRKGRLDLESAYRISVEDFEDVNRRSKVDKWDVLVSMIGTIGEVYLVDHEPDFAIKNIGLFKSRDEARGKWLYYYLCTPRVQGLLRQHSRGTTQQYVPLGELRKLPVAYPTNRKELERIVTILSHLDDKIELNRRMSETLEGIARELYRAWFVDFTAGPATSHNSSGELPAGWFYGTLADVSELSSESWQAKSAPDKVVYLDLSSVKWGRVLETLSYSWDEAPSRARRILRNGDTIVGTVRPGNGSYSLITHEGLTGSTGFAVLRPKAPNARAITYLAATDPTNVERLAHLADGAAYPAVRPPVVHESPMTVPDQETLLTFSSAVDPLLDRIAVCEAENQTLEALRDTLLPKLISGELRVPEVEQLVSEVA